MDEKETRKERLSMEEHPRAPREWKDRYVLGVGIPERQVASTDRSDTEMSVALLERGDERRDGYLPIDLDWPDELDDGWDVPLYRLVLERVT